MFIFFVSKYCMLREAPSFVFQFSNSSTLIQSLSLLLIFKKCLISVIFHLNTLVCFISHAFCIIFYLYYNFFKFQRKICISLQKQTIFVRFFKKYFLLSQFFFFFNHSFIWLLRLRISFLVLF